VSAPACSPLEIDAIRHADIVARRVLGLYKAAAWQPQQRFALAKLAAGIELDQAAAMLILKQ
jgi:hypothetical protein